MPLENENLIAPEEFQAEELSLSSGFRPRILLQGVPGAGKTTFINSLPGTKFVIDIKGNPESLAGFKNIRVKRVTEPDPSQAYGWTMAELARKEVFELYEKGECPTCIIIDTLTGLQEVALNRCMLLHPARATNMGTPVIAHYQGLKDHLMKYLTSLFALPAIVLATAHEELVKDEQAGNLVWLPLLTGKHQTELPKEFTEVYAMLKRRDEQKTVYILDTEGGSERPMLKSTMNQLGRFWSGPQEPNFRSLLVKRFGEKEVKSLEKASEISKQAD